jgi:hypothetical protein
MVFTVLVGSAYGGPALAVFHSYFGIIVFVVFVTVFWILIVRWLDHVEGSIMPPMQEDTVTKTQEPNATD